MLHLKSVKPLFWLGLLLCSCQIDLTPSPKPVQKVIVAPVPSSNRVESSTASINLAWNRNPEPNIAGYRIYYGEASGLYSETQDAGNEVTATVANLMIGTTYYFALSAYDENTFESPRSDEISQVAGAGASPSPTIEPSATPTATSTPAVTATSTPSPTATATSTPTPASIQGTLGNISTRGFVQSGDNALIAGFVLLDSEKRIIVRAIGPSLSVYFPHVLINPILELRNGFGELIIGNDNWRSDQQNEIIATGLAPSNNLEAAVVRILPPGSYTVIVRGVNNGTGVALVEVYALE